MFPPSNSFPHSCLLALVLVANVGLAVSYRQFSSTSVGYVYLVPAGNSASLCANYIDLNPSLPGQCNPPSLSVAETLCSSDANCGGVMCSPDGSTCVLRYLPLSSAQADSNWNFYSKTYLEYVSTSVAGVYLVPPGNSVSLCASYINVNPSFPGQCNPPDLGTAETLCDSDANCGGVMCHTDFSACVLRYLPLTALQADSTWNFFGKGQ